MATPLEEIEFTLFETPRRLVFTTAEDLDRWLESEGSFWHEKMKWPQDQNLVNYWIEQSSFFSTARNLTANYVNAIHESDEGRARQIHRRIVSHLTGLTTGTIVSSDNDLYPAIVDLATHNSDVAALVMLAARSDANNLLGHMSSAPVRSLIQLSLLNSRAKGSKDWLTPHRKELTGLQSQYQTELTALQSLHQESATALTGLQTQSEEAKESRGREWSEQRDSFNEEWTRLKRIYDEQLALLAPTQYWDKRAKMHALQAAIFASIFCIVLGITLSVFVFDAMPHLLTASKAKDVSPLLALIPVAIPAFAAIWVLKILSRLLSENLQMMRDARERETMVKTFLALMHDEERGKTLVRDEDRILILHALFRPSAVNAVDDAPPVHWFDILSNKVGAKK